MILIIGILAAITLPAMAAEEAKGQDASANSAARSLLTQIASSDLEEHDLRPCDDATALKVKGLAFGADPGQVEVIDATKDTATVRGHSRSGNHFRTLLRADGRGDRVCDTAGRGSCHEDATW